MSAPKSSGGCGYLFWAAFALAGAVSLLAAGRGYRRGDDRWAMLALGGTGVVFVTMAVGFGVPMRRVALRQQREAGRRAAFPHEPWKWREAWTAERIEAMRDGGAAAMWFFAVICNSISIPAAIGAARKIAAGEKFLVVV